QGLIKEEDIDVSVKRLLKARFELGEMDNLEDVSWSKIPYSVVASAKHDSLALDIARKSITLLQNKNQILPLQKGGKTIAVMGPNANDSVMQWGNYNGTPAATTTILQGIQQAAGKDDKVVYIPGCSWVERTLTRSVYNQCKSEGGQGFTATYWNNTNFEGEPVATMQMESPFSLCTMGATVFAPGVNLTDFSATYKSVYTPKESGDVVFEMYTCGAGDLLIDGEKVKGFKNNHGGRTTNYTMKAEAGKSYNIELQFKYNAGSAQLNFDMGFKETVNIPKVVAQVKDADVIVFAGGISPRLEGEEMGVKLPGFRGGDRTDIELPTVQRELLQALAAAGKKVVFINCSGSPIGLVPETKSCQAIVQAWYPGQAGGKAVADVLFGAYNPSGKLPVTFYKNVDQLPDFEDYNMAGRTYRYFQGQPLYPFGYGLSYTTFAYGDIQVPASAKVGEAVKVVVPVTNSGKMCGDEVVQLYLKKQGDAEGPIKTLRAFKRVHIPAGETVQVELELTPKQLEWWNPET
ncbi:MAG: glycoside hydrolase family 3 C-terminal domain-containing protein, partial [Bacteroides sp.]|nr:glycoside hydrolase family 3 C-terminal domain-containing protein [Bacteroides sp.]